MREPKAYAALILAAACACERSPGRPPSAPATVVPVASASAAPLAVEPAPPARETAEEDGDAHPTDLASHSEPNGSPPALPSSNGAPFDRGRAAAALGAVNVQSCAHGAGPRGNGHVKITFSTSGHVRAVVLDSRPFLGTAVGSCVASRYRAVTVPPFGGGDVTVGKSFTIQ